jgi:hypothetical protein
MKEVARDIARSTIVVAQIIGHDKIECGGHRVQSYTPVFALCRKLIEAGFDSNRPMHAYRGDALCLTVRSLGEGAKLTVGDDSTGRPRFRPYRDPNDSPSHPPAPTGLLHSHRSPLKSPGGGV